MVSDAASPPQPPTTLRESFHRTRTWRAGEKASAARLWGLLRSGVGVGWGGGGGAMPITSGCGANPPPPLQISELFVFNLRVLPLLLGSAPSRRTPSRVSRPQFQQNCLLLSPGPGTNWFLRSSRGLLPDRPVVLEGSWEHLCSWGVSVLSLIICMTLSKEST